MANKKKAVSYIVPHLRNRFTGTFTNRSNSLIKTSYSSEVGIGVCPPKTTLAPCYATLCANRQELFNHRGSILENYDNALIVSPDPTAMYIEKIEGLLKVSPDPTAMYTQKIERLLKVGQIDAAAATLKEMVDKGFWPIAEEYTMVIDRLFALAEGEDRALKLLKEMAFDLGITVRPKSHLNTYNSLLHGLRILSRREDISKLLMDMEDKATFVNQPNLYTYNIFVDAYCKEGRLEDAESLFKLMIQKNIDPNLDSCTGLIDGYCLQGNMSKSRELFDLMKSTGLEPTVPLYNGLIKGYFKDKKVEEAMQLFYELKNYVEPRLPITYGTLGLYRVVRRESKIDHTLYTLKPRPDKCTNKIVLEGLCDNDKLEEAVSLVQWMGDVPSPEYIDLYNILIYGASKRGKLHTAKILYNSLLIKGLEPNAMTYASMIYGFCVENRAGEAKELLLEMMEKDFPLNKEICNFLIRGSYLEITLHEYKWTLVRKLWEKGFTWAPYSYIH